jgi:hypothetical protein
MKKLIIVLVLLLAAAALFGQDMGKFPAGKWLDPNWDGLWEFSAGGTIKISDSKTGELYYDFTGKLQGLKVSLEGMVPVITFSNSDTEKTYTFKANLADNTVELSIDRAGKSKYTVKMAKQ